MAQCKLNYRGFLSKGITVRSLIEQRGDVHHIFPKAYLKKNGVDIKTKYNQVANFTYLDTQVNKAVGEDAPNVYFGKILNQCKSGKIEIGNILSEDELYTNLEENCIPKEIVTMTVKDYEKFLMDRRKLMAKLIEKYYKGL